MESLNMEAPAVKDEWDTTNDVDIYQRIRLRYSRQVQKLYCIHKELILIIFIYIFTCGGMLIYSISNINILQDKVKIISQTQTTSDRMVIDDLMQKYIELSNITNFQSMHPKSVSKAYLPYGPQSNVSLLSVTSSGWINCYLDSYGDEKSESLDIIFNAFCTAQYLMLACKKRGNENIDVLAWGGRNHILFHIENEYKFHTIQGTKWIYHNSSYLGFAGPNDEVVIGVLEWNTKEDGQYLKVKCDTYSNLASFYGDHKNSSKRLCWPIIEKFSYNGDKSQNGKKSQLSFGKGGICFGNTWGKSDEWERLIFERESI